MEWLLHFRNLFELIYFISGPVLAVGLIIALLQYFQIKKDIVNKYARDIANSTINDINNFNIIIEPLYEDYLMSLNDNLGFNYGKEYKELSDKDLYETSKEYYLSISQYSINRVKKLAVEMNKFSLGFTFLLSADSQAKEIIGLKYIQIYESILFIFSVMSVDNKTNFESVLRLYANWSHENQLSDARRKFAESKQNIDSLEKMAREPLKPIGK